MSTFGRRRPRGRSGARAPSSPHLHRRARMRRLLRQQAADPAPTERRTPTPTLDRQVAPEPGDLRTDLGALRPEEPGRLQQVYDDNLARIQAARDEPTPTQAAAREQFLESWQANEDRYREVAEQAGIPAELVAALHWRESSGDFSTYLHQGDPLGKKATHVPTDIPVFDTWEPAAVDALGRFDGLREDLGIGADTRDMAALATFAEHYNGLGYHNRGLPSPYVFAGTDQYERGKYVADGTFSPTTVDQQPGVVYLMEGIRALEAEQAAEAKPAS